ncbi:cupredoxin domain-containing protein [Paenibacillus sp. CF384]|uniref:cupredoxin domain-containing protein n=1 Tax=Paenibacillus sp. CF384 TaxID=1884382 RepID=UPI0008961DEC|nr:cupredoxin domain-containing protein [Paenibacillus sp. CF384]SDX80081.1 cytochrome c oxidase subunit 2 [Paenibacillus sp. CF384]
MKAKFAILAAALLLIAALVSACGNNNGNNGNGNSNNGENEGKATNETSTNAAADPASGPTVEIKLEAKDFEYDQQEIRVKKGDHVKITLHSDDAGHGFSIADYNVDIKGDGEGEFDAANAGTFEFHCSVMCGSGHRDMVGKLIVDET